MSDNKVTSFTASDRTAMGVTNVQADRTFIDSIKTFPINVEIQSLRTYGMNSSTRTPASTTGSVTLALNTSIVLLPEKPMQPRYFDEHQPRGDHLTLPSGAKGSESLSGW